MHQLGQTRRALENVKELQRPICRFELPHQLFKDFSLYCQMDASARLKFPCSVAKIGFSLHKLLQHPATKKTKITKRENLVCVCLCMDTLSHMHNFPFVKCYTSIDTHPQASSDVMILNQNVAEEQMELLICVSSVNV